MAVYDVEMRHTEKTFESLARMQYDLFCKGNLVGRTVLAAGAIVLGMANAEGGWGLLLVAYGCYLLTGKYNSANHTAHKLADQIRNTGMSFPASRYLFHGEYLEIVPIPEDRGERERLDYADLFRLSEDYQYYYLFQNRYGGYMVPKQALGEKELEFRDFIQKKTGLTVRNKFAPIVRVLRHVGGKSSD